MTGMLYNMYDSVLGCTSTMRKFRSAIIFFFFAQAIFLFHTAVSLAQPPVDKNQPGKIAGKKSEDPALLRWKISLDSLAREARTVFPEERRPYAMADVASTFWDVDRVAARLQYISALDTALALTHKDKKYQPMVNYVLSSATRRDAGLVRELNKRLLDDEKGRDDISSEIAQDLLDENPEAAAQLAEAFAPNGLLDGSAAFLIYGLAKKDVRLSDRVYAVYLAKVSADENFAPERILALAGYSFGYAEFYSVDKRGELSGASFLPVSGLFANPSFSASFLDLAYRRVAISIERRDRAVGPDIEALNYPILFALAYLLPEVAKFSPNTTSAWQQLEQRGMVGATVEQLQKIRSHVKQINETRQRLQNIADDPEKPDRDAEASLDDVEKLPGACRRDVVYSKAALRFSYSRNFKRALEIAGNIEDLKQNESVKEAISLNMVESAIENEEFEDARKKAEKITSPEQKARLFAELAKALAGTNDIGQADDAVSEALKLTEKLSGPRDRAAFYFSISKTILKTGPPEAPTILRSGVKNLNKLEPADEMDYSIPVKVSLSCPGEPETWYGGADSLSNSNVFEALASYADQDPDEAARVAEEISDKITRIRALAIVTKIALGKIKAASAAKPKPRAN